MTTRKTSLKSTRPKPAVKHKPKSLKIIANQYDGGTYNYLKYWNGRDYENAAEEIAINKFIKNKRFKHAVDVGGGYGRLCLLLEKYADNVTLAEPSKKQLDIAKDYLKGHNRIQSELMQADDLKFKDSSIDLLTMIRVMHHLPDPSKEFNELHRILSKDGYLVLELANYSHFRNRIKHLVNGQRLPLKPVDVSSKQNRNKEVIAFVNHNPKTVIKQLDRAGFRVEKTLSVSNLRSPTLKKIIPYAVMVNLERIMQPMLARMYFGPSIFFLLRKK